jgi:hypothetical protein
MTRLKQIFYEQLLTKINAQTPLFNNVSARNENALYTISGNVGYQFNLRKNVTFVRFFIDNRYDTLEKNKKCFEKLEAHKKEIEMKMGILLWEFNEKNKVCYLTKKIDGGYDDEKKWDDLQKSMVENMILLAESTEKYRKIC